MEALSFLPLAAYEGMQERNEKDFIRDGLIYCGNCKKPRQKRIRFPIGGNQEKVVWVLCECGAAKLERENARFEFEEKMRRINRIKSASMMPGKLKTASFDSFEVKKENSKAYRISREYVDNFLDMEKVNQGLLFYGPVGTGKSYTAACIANALMEKEIPVIMTSFVKILQDFWTFDQSGGGYLETLNEARLLIVDDLGAERNTDYSLEKVYSVVEDRIRANKPMILTTNLTLEEMMQVHDIRYKRIYDRIFEACFPVLIDGTSFRLRQAAARQEAMRRMLDFT